MNNKQIKKADKLVKGAVSTFSDAIIEVEKANDILASEVATDEKLIHKYIEQIRGIEQSIDSLNVEISEKEKMILSNVDLINKLRQFTH